MQSSSLVGLLRFFLGASAEIKSLFLLQSGRPFSYSTLAAITRVLQRNLLYRRDPCFWPLPDIIP